jgi:hypothetical protein
MYRIFALWLIDIDIVGAWWRAGANRRIYASYHEVLHVLVTTNKNCAGVGEVGRDGRWPNAATSCAGRKHKGVDGDRGKLPSQRDEDGRNGQQQTVLDIVFIRR